MQIKRHILSPVKREDFETAFNKNSTNLTVTDPDLYFRSSIDHIKKFAVGQYGWFIANTATGHMQSAGGMIEQITAIPLTEFVNSKPERLFGQTHPEDIEPLFAFTNHWISYFISQPSEKKMHLHPTIYIRLKNQQGVYRWNTVQYADHIIDTTGHILFGLTVVTDISHIKKEGPAMMSVLNSFDKSCQHYFCSDTNTIAIGEEVLPKISIRELEVLQYLATGRSSKQIAAELNIAIKTVDNHRQNMLRKTGSKSTGELINFAVKTGYI